MNTYRITTSLIENGKLLLQDLPFEEGDEVEVVILDKNEKKKIDCHSLKGTVIEYGQPFEAAILDEDWEVLK